jgi:methyl-accepting chemotaxis protein
MLSTIRGKVTAILSSFALLLGAGTLASHVVLKRQADDGLIVNLAGRQRMLTQKMTKECAQLVNAAHDQDATQVADLRDLLQSTMRVFETTLYALKDGGPAPINLEMTRMRQTPPASTAEIAKQLETVVALWEPFKENLTAVARSNGTNTAAASAVMSANVQILGQMNKAVDLMQADAEQKVNVLYLVQGAAFALGVILLAVGVWVARVTVARPLQELAAAASAMSTGKLDVKIEMGGAKEVKELAASFDRMRASMLAMLGGGLRATGTDDDI